MAGFYVFLALSTALAFAALFSFLLLRFKSPRRLVIEVDPDRLRVVKHERATVSITVLPRQPRWYTIASASVHHTSGISLRHEPGQPPGAFIIDADFAGRFELDEIRVTLEDVLGIFSRVEMVRPETFVAEVLPISILNAPNRTMSLSITSGETPAGFRGRGQEFYGIEEYAGLGDSKDILWKRVAKVPTEKIVSRVREANVPQWLKVCLIELGSGDRKLWMDEATEALGKIGVILLGNGAGLEVVVPSNDRAYTVRAKNFDELVDLLMEVWKAKCARKSVTEIALDADVIITSSSAFALPEIYALSDSKTTLVVVDSGPPTIFGSRARPLTEDLELESLLAWAAVK